MCGIAGTLDFQARPIAESHLRRACDLLHHRGPDDSGVQIDAGPAITVGFAAVRLAVVDPSPAGHQPMAVGDGRYLLVYNGELYNFRELRGELIRAGWCFRTETDTEVVATACAHWGPAALPRFNGMFALAFFDRTTRRGFLARDVFGIKPLLIAREPGRVHFASEMTALRCLGAWDRALNGDALLHYLHLGYFAAPQTIYTHAQRVPPGAYQLFDPDGLGDPVTYSPSTAGTQPVSAQDRHPTQPNPPPYQGGAGGGWNGTDHALSHDARDKRNCRGVISYSDACAAIRDALFHAVARRRIADVPLGAFLSGGIDSAIIATHLAECTPGPIQTFAIGFTEHARYDETRYARVMADHLASRHHELRISFDDVIAELPAVLDHLGEPFFDSSILPTAILSRLARNHVTVCLSGDGGDELFGGYWRYLGHAAGEAWTRVPRPLRTAVLDPLLRRMAAARLSGWSNRVRQMRKLLRAADESPQRRHLRWSTILDAASAGILRAPHSPAGDLPPVVAELEERMRRWPDPDPLNQIFAFDTRYGLPGDMLHKVDLASMRHSLEVRVPFLDPDVVALAERCPSRYKIDRGLRKRLLVDAYRGRIPDMILDREKAGFELPIGEFLRTQLRDLFLSTVTRETVETFDVLDHAGIMQVYADHCARRGDHADLLFALLSLCWWRQREPKT